MPTPPTGPMKTPPPKLPARLSAAMVMVPLMVADWFLFSMAMVPVPPPPERPLIVRLLVSVTPSFRSKRVVELVCASIVTVPVPSAPAPVTMRSPPRRKVPPE